MEDFKESSGTKAVLLSGLNAPLSEGLELDFGKRSFSQNEIIDFARKFDPLPIHTDPVYARDTRWKGIIASGPMMFIEFHKDRWIPRFGKTVVAGVYIGNWNFLKPLYPDAEASCECRARKIVTTSEKLRPDECAVDWSYRFTDIEGEEMQSVEFRVIHELEKDGLPRTNSGNK